MKVVTNWKDQSSCEPRLNNTVNNLSMQSTHVYYYFLFPFQVFKIIYTYATTSETHDLLVGMQFSC